MEEPSSPGTNPVELRNCIEELVKFTLQSHLNGTLESDIRLTKEFSSSLLNHHSGQPISANAYGAQFFHLNIVADSSETSQNALHKQLALALYEVITSNCNNLESFDQSSDLKLKEEWFDLVQKEGSELAKILKSINFELHVQEPFFTQLNDGLKTIEGRCAAGDYNRIASGALILFNKCLVLEVQDIHHYASFSEMLEAEGLEKVLPGVKTLDEGIQVYRKFYSEEKEMTNGVLAICVAKVAAQPYHSLARILSGLKNDGVLSLLIQGLPSVSIP